MMNGRAEAGGYGPDSSVNVMDRHFSSGMEAANLFGPQTRAFNYTYSDRGVY